MPLLITKEQWKKKTKTKARENTNSSLEPPAKIGIKAVLDYKPFLLPSGTWIRPITDRFHRKLSPVNKIVPCIKLHSQEKSAVKSHLRILLPDTLLDLINYSYP